MRMSNIKAKPQRMCVVCKEMKDKPVLIRIVLNKQGEMKVDETGKGHGRGAYVCPDCAASASKVKGLERAFKQKIPNEIYEALGKH